MYDEILPYVALLARPEMTKTSTFSQYLLLCVLSPPYYLLLRLVISMVIRNILSLWSHCNFARESGDQNCINSLAFYNILSV